MPNHKSAKKRIYVSQKKKALNRSQNSEVKTTIKKFNNAIDTLNLELAEKLLSEVFSELDSAVSKGVLHKNNAANRKAALSKKLHEVKTGKVEVVIKKDQIATKACFISTIALIDCRETLNSLRFPLQTLRILNLELYKIVLSQKDITVGCFLHQGKMYPSNWSGRTSKMYPIIKQLAIKAVQTCCSHIVQEG